MIGQISPLVKGTGRHDWMGAAIAFTIGSTASAALLGFVLGIPGVVVGNLWKESNSPLLAGAIFLGCGLVETGVVPWTPPSPSRQTPKGFKEVFGTMWGAFAWGLDLGQGWTTRIEYVGYYGLVLWSLLRGGPGISAVVLSAFGLGRGIPVLLDGLTVRFGARQLDNSWYVLHSDMIHWLDGAVLAFVAGYIIMT